MRLKLGRSITFILSLALLFSTGACLAKKIPLPKGTLFDGRVEGLIYGKTVEAVSPDQKTRQLIYFVPNGNIRQVRNQELEQGTWKITEKGRLCVQVEDQKKQCRILVPDAEGYRLYQVKKDGKHTHTMSFISFHTGDNLAKLTKGPILPRGTLGRKRVEKLFSGKTVESLTADKGRVSLTYYGPKGEVIQERKGQRRAGQWRVAKAGRICLQMENLKEKCRIIVKEGNVYKKYIVKKNGRHQHTVSYRSFTPGNQLQ